MGNIVFRTVGDILHVNKTLLNSPLEQPNLKNNRPKWSSLKDELIAFKNKNIGQSIKELYRFEEDTLKCHGKMWWVITLGISTFIIIRFIKKSCIFEIYIEFPFICHQARSSISFRSEMASKRKLLPPRHCKNKLWSDEVVWQWPGMTFFLLEH